MGKVFIVKFGLLEEGVEVYAFGGRVMVLRSCELSFECRQFATEA